MHTRYGLIEGDRVLPIDAPPWIGDPTVQGSAECLSDVRLEVPVIPSKIVAVGRNYADHAAELGNPVPKEPLLFLKPPSALLAHDGVILLPQESDRVEFEGEIALVIGRRARRVAPEDAAKHVAGVTAFVDVTARDLQRRDVQFTRGKGFDTFAPCGPWVETEVDPCDLRLQTRVNGTLRQDARSAEMIHSPWNLVSYVSQVMTLEPGDLLVAGTPAGVGALSPGDRIEVSVEGVGTLASRVETEA